MAISITAHKCTADSYTVSISSPVEPGGGDHIASIDLRDRRATVSIKIDGAEVGPSISLWFSSAGETYHLEVKNLSSKDVEPNAVTLHWPYTVHGVYAPSWADVQGEIRCSLVFEACCVASGYVYETYLGNPRLASLDVTTYGSVPPINGGGGCNVGDPIPVSWPATANGNPFDVTFNTAVWNYTSNKLMFEQVIDETIVVTKALACDGVTKTATQTIRVRKLCNDRIIRVTTDGIVHVPAGAGSLTCGTSVVCDYNSNTLITNVPGLGTNGKLELVVDANINRYVGGGINHWLPVFGIHVYIRAGN